jgi:hypothetical protein
MGSAYLITMVRAIGQQYNIKVFAVHTPSILHGVLVG